MSNTNTTPFNMSEVIAIIEAEGLNVTQGTEHPRIAEVAKLMGFTTYNLSITAPSSLFGRTDSEIEQGVVVTHVDIDSNNGVYVFFFHNDGTTSMMSIVPSTIDKSALIRKAVGDITLAIENLDLPMLTTFDKVEVAGFVLVRSVIKPLMAALRIPEDKEDLFTQIYFPRFLANTARQYFGDPELAEETVEMEPFMAKNMVLDNDALRAAKESSDDSTNT